MARYGPQPKPPEEQWTTWTVRLPQELRAELQAWAASQGRPLAALARETLGRAARRALADREREVDQAPDPAEEEGALGDGRALVHEIACTLVQARAGEVGE